MKDHEAFWLLDGKTDKPKTTKTTQPVSPNSFSVAERVDGTYGLENCPLYVTTCATCGEESPPRSQDLMREWRHAHALQHGGSS